MQKAKQLKSENTENTDNKKRKRDEDSDSASKKKKEISKPLSSNSNTKLAGFAFSKEWLMNKRVDFFNKIKRLFCSKLAENEICVNVNEIYAHVINLIYFRR